MRQHAGFATQARRRGESLLGCNTCGMVHARNLSQAAPAEPVEQWPAWKIAVTVVMGLGFVWALGFIGSAAAA